jgi:hypothetical protein
MQPPEEAGQGERTCLEMLKLLAVIAAAAALSGCATIARGTGEQVAFDTVPSGAEVRVVVEGPGGGAPPPDGSPVSEPVASMGCITPCVLQVKRLDKMAVTVTKPGYEQEAFSLVRANAKNRFGAYTGLKETAVIFRGGKIDTTNQEYGAMACTGAVYEPFPEIEEGYRAPAPARPSRKPA